ncbi:hypothetical protein F5Y15DRAFT_425118 [Xylariaceae sp. FL0016]|nr:hypothetical protein F5Y15DRAFT_425118 [Xylariaceae sp. FL0016]
MAKYGIDVSSYALTAPPEVTADCWTIRAHHDGNHKGIFAKKPIPDGTLILLDRPVVSVTKAQMRVGWDNITQLLVHQYEGLSRAEKEQYLDLEYDREGSDDGYNGVQMDRILKLNMSAAAVRGLSDDEHAERFSLVMAIRDIWNNNRKWFYPGGDDRFAVANVYPKFALFRDSSYPKCNWRFYEHGIIGVTANQAVKEKQQLSISYY